MRFLTTVLCAVLLAGLTGRMWAAESHPAGAEVAVALAAGGAVVPAAEAEHGLPPNAVRLHDSLITNSMVVTWIVALSIILFARYATRRLQEVPSGAQNFWEWLVESLYDFLEGIVGSELIKKSFWFFATVFIFILFSNWFGLIPAWARLAGGTRANTGSR